jgi:hypothetical protein
MPAIIFRKGEDGTDELFIKEYPDAFMDTLQKKGNNKFSKTEIK